MVTVGVGIGIPLLHNGSGDGRRRQAAVTSPSPTPSTPTKYPLPPLGAAGFPASIYPLAHRGLVPGTVRTCPSAAGLQAPSSGTRDQAIRITRHFETRRFTADLRATDRAYWPQIAADWRGGSAHRQRTNGGHILHTGPLSAPWPRLGVPDPKTWVRESCGGRIMRRSYVVTGGPPQSGALQEVQVFVVRGGRPLLYFEYP
jgi:hypothetical protein